MKSIRLCLISVSFFFILVSQVFALGLLSEGNKRISYKPGLEKTYPFLVQHTTRDVKIIVNGDLMEYVTVSRDVIQADDPDKSFYVTIKFPETTPTPGHHQIKVEASEIVDRENGIGTSVDVATHIKLDVMYPGKYAEVSFNDISVANKTAYFGISATNFGLEKINSFKARIDTYDADGNKLDSVYTNEKSIEPDKKETVTAELDVGRYKIGDYKAKATAFWDENQTIVENVFRVGALKINIVDYTKEFAAGIINKFEVNLENVWNDPIKDVYVIVGINDEYLRSATADMDAFSSKTFDVYWDTTNVKPGEYDVQINAYYLDKSTMEIGKVKVVGKIQEMKLAEGKGFPTFTVVLVSLLLLIIILDIIFMHRKKKE